MRLRTKAILHGLTKWKKYWTLIDSLRIKNNLSPSALCRKLLINTSRIAYAEFQQFRAVA